MPSPLTIPRTQKPQMGILLNLDEEIFADLLAALHDADATAEWPVFFNHVAQKMTREIPNLDILLNTIASFYPLPAYLDASKEEVARDLSMAYCEAEHIPEEKQKEFEQRLLQLLAFDATIGMTAKAVQIVQSNERTFTESKFITDLRPIFMGDQTDAPSAAVFVHTLQLEYRQKDQEIEFFVSLDSRDLSVLRRAIDRAQDKEKALRKKASEWSLPILEVIEE